MYSKLQKMIPRGDSQFKMSIHLLTAAAIGGCVVFMIGWPNTRLPICTGLAGLWIGGIRKAFLIRKDIEDKLRAWWKCKSRVDWRKPIEFWVDHPVARKVASLVARQIAALFIAVILLVTGVSQIQLVGDVLLGLALIECATGQLLGCGLSAIVGGSLLVTVHFQMNPGSFNSLMGITLP